MCTGPPGPLVTTGWQVYGTEQALSTTFSGFSEGKSGKWQKAQNSFYLNNAKYMCETSV